METDTLFENHTIKEIQDIEKKLRNDIERKKEELRQMVGERYRDLMEAADTITEMKQTAENVADRINAMETNCQLLEQSSLKAGLIKTVKHKVAQRKRTNENLYAIAALIKILMDSPSKIWGYIEVEDYLSAMLLYVLARHTHATLILDPFYSKQNILAHFPVVSKQWASIRHFQHLLLQKAKEVFLSERITAEKVVGPICCVLFLSNTTVEEALEEILSNRKVVILNIFKPEKSAKSQICELVDVLQDTLAFIHMLFYPETDGFSLKTNLLHETVAQITHNGSAGPISLLDASSPTFPYLTKDIKTYRPSLKVKFEGISVAYLQRICSDWIVQVKAAFQSQLKDLLNFVCSIKGLALIKEAALERLQVSLEWNIICNHLLYKPFSVWDFFLHETFMERIKEVINNCLEIASQECRNGVDEGKIINQNNCIEENIPSYVWCESQSDLAPDLGWVTHHHRHLWEGGTLGVKALALTPSIQQICKNLDRELGNLLEDVSHFRVNGESDQQITKYYNSSKEDVKKPCDCYVDFHLIHDHLTDVCQKYFFDVAGYFENLMNSFEEPETNVNPSSTRLVRIGHLCNGLTKLCPHLVQCMLRNSPNSLAASHLSGLAITSKDDQLWQCLKTKFLELSDRAFSIWSKQKMTIIIETFNEEFSVCSVSGLLKTLLEWDKVEIQEESEEGNAVRSTLRIPQQVSVPLYKALFSFCWEINTIGGHALSSHVKSEIQESFYLHLMKMYEKKVSEEWPEDLLNSHLVQTQCLQFYFDVQFLSGLLGGGGNSGKASDKASAMAKSVLEKVVANIDPFDMDVFSPHIQTNLRRTIQRSLLLFGLCVPQEQFSHLNILKVPSSNQIEHSLMLMPTACSRFPLLPFASHSTSSISSAQDSARKLAASLQASPLKAPASYSSSPNLTSTENLANMLKSSSFYDRVTAMSSSWFSSS